MSVMDDDIARVMADHEHEAPRAADLLAALEQRSAPGWQANRSQTGTLLPSRQPRRLGQRPRRLARWYAPIAAAAAVAAIAVATVWAGGLFGTHPGAPVGPAKPVNRAATPLTCPATHAGSPLWVPAGPRHVDDRPRLVPLRTPSTAVICAYPGSNMEMQTGWALSGRRVLTGGFADLAGLLAWQPRAIPGQGEACTQVAGHQTDFLIGLTYPDGGRLWVAGALDPNLCIGSTNGEFTSPGDLGLVASKAFGTGKWPTRRAPSCSGPPVPQAGHLGQATAMVPAGSTSVTICTAGAHVTTSNDKALVSALNTLPTRTSTQGCSGTSSPSEQYLLYFSYPQGPPVTVAVTLKCYPQIDNLSLQSESARTVLPIIRQLLGAKG
ncbi:MAG: hypothetical protein ACYCVZ_18560 [Streptosporangiaceae bacterium]